jgi:hypothetical protein
MPMTFDISARDLTDKFLAPAHQLKSRQRSSPDRRQAALRDLVTIDSGLYISGYDGCGTPYYRVDNVRSLVSNESQGDVALIAPARVDSIPSRCKCKMNDVVISRTGTLGKAFLATGRHEGAILSQHLTRLASRDCSRLAPGYLALYLNSPEGKFQLISLGAGSTRLELTHGDIEKVLVPILPIDRQMAYHNALTDALATYYGALVHLEDLHHQIRQVLGVSAAPRGSMHFDTLSNALDRLWLPQRYRPEFISVLSQVLESREHVVLGDHFTFQRGKGTITAEYEASGIPFVRTSSLANYCIDPFPDHYAAADTYERFRQKISGDVVLYSIEGRIGHSALVDSTLPVVTKNHIEQLRLHSTPKDVPANVFTGWVLAILRTELGAIQVSANMVTQSTIPGLASRLREFVIPLPTEDEFSMGLDYYTMCKELLRATVLLQTLNDEFLEELSR